MTGIVLLRHARSSHLINLIIAYFFNITIIIHTIIVAIAIMRQFGLWQLHFVACRCNEINSNWEHLANAWAGSSDVQQTGRHVFHFGFMSSVLQAMLKTQELSDFLCLLYWAIGHNPCHGSFTQPFPIRPNQANGPNYLLIFYCDSISSRCS